jgi:hypothetical protein
MRRLARISSPIFKILSGLTKVLGRRAWGSFSTWSRPSRNDFAQLNTLGCKKHSSPNCAWSLVKISEGMTPSFVGNLIYAAQHCWVLLALPSWLHLMVEAERDPTSVGCKFKHVITCQRKHVHTSWFVLERELNSLLNLNYPRIMSWAREVQSRLLKKSYKRTLLIRSY